MTLDRAIKYCEEKAKELREQPFKERMDIEDIADCEECAEDYEQIVGWLKELKEYRHNDNRRRCSNCTEWEYLEGYGNGCFCMRTMVPLDDCENFVYKKR